MRRLTRAVTAALAVAAAATAAALGGPAGADAAGAGAAAWHAAASRHAAAGPGARPRRLSLVITSVSPAYARAGQRVTVSGSVTNLSSARLAGVSIQLRSSNIAFNFRDALQGYADGSGPVGEPVPGAIKPLRGPLRPRASAMWSVRLPVNLVRMTKFGVYPLAAEAETAAGTVLASSRTFLPFWPGKHGPDPQRQEIAWIWPLIDQPRQGACPGLLNNGLAASLASGGRLSGLLAAGLTSYAGAADLTWAIDPALLAGVSAMTSPYRVGPGPRCQAMPVLPASRAAAAWLAGLKRATAGRPLFVTPYADVDEVALVRRGMETDLTRAFKDGRTVASRILGRDLRATSGVGTGQASTGQASTGQLNGVAWPADGIADYQTFQSLAGVDGITRVVLDTTTLPPLTSQSSTPSAQASTPDGVGPDLHVLLADAAITQVLAAANSPADPPGAAFAVAQRYLAETAMIAAEAPNTARSIVVAPPRRWDPPAALPRELLAQTVRAPWLRPVSLAQLAAARSAPGQVRHHLAAVPEAAALPRSLLSRVKQLDQSVQLLQSLQVRPDPTLDLAVASVESGAWRGGSSHDLQARKLLKLANAYLAGQQSGLTIISPHRVTLGGLKGTVPVSIDNRLGYAVRVQLSVTQPSDGSIQVADQPGVVEIAGDTLVNIKLVVSAAAIGSGTLALSLLTPTGLPLPGSRVAMTVQATHYGTLALIIIAAALGVFMLTSAARAVRRGRAVPQPPEDPPRAGQSSPDQAGQEPQRPGEPPKADNVESDRPDGRAADDYDPEATDEYARTPGRADRS